MRLLDERGRFQGRAFYSDKSQIALRLLTRDDVSVDREFFMHRLEQAAAYRKVVVENTEAWRVVYGEADHLPSLIVDRYGDYVVMQTLSQGTERLCAFPSTDPGASWVALGMEKTGWRTWQVLWARSA